MALAGGLVAAYACSQFFGLDFFVPSSVYTFNSDGAKIVRVGSSIGHADHLGNFLLYTTPLSLDLRSPREAERVWLLLWQPCFQLPP